MKRPFHGHSSFTPTNLPDSAKNEFLRDRSPRYMRVALSEPIRQVGREFSFVVVAVTLTPDMVFKQAGRAVVCQTEDEAKESLELLSARDKEHIVVAQGAGFGIVGKVKNFRSVITEVSARSRPARSGTNKWFALEREIDKATGEVTVLRRQDAANETEATRIAKRWQQEYEQAKKHYFDSIARSNTPLPPPRCKSLSSFELKDDIPAAKWIALKRQWPHTFEVFEKRKTSPDARISDHELQDAYLLDLVEQGYDPKAETIRGDLKLAAALTKAARRYARSGKKKVTDLAIYLIAFNYELGWCYFSDAELAEKLSEIITTPFTPGQVKQYRSRGLGLVAKHLPGPSPKCP